MELVFSKEILEEFLVLWVDVYDDFFWFYWDLGFLVGKGRVDVLFKDKVSCILFFFLGGSSKNKVVYIEKNCGL